jgi:1-acyl-sn-glycerol-3-phosphate acyltransferase
VLAHVLMAHYRRRPHVVLKDALRLDPAIDLLLTRMGCTWVPPRSRRTSSSAEAIPPAAAGLEPDQALLLFPEGADWTPVRHLAAVTRLRRRGLLREARLALRMPHVLPPHPAGAAAALRGAPTADVLVFTHTGHDELLDASAAWRSLPLRDPLRMAWWRPSTRPGATADDEQVLAWLREIWQEIEHWVSEQQHLAALTGEAGAVGAQPTSSG